MCLMCVPLYRSLGQSGGDSVGGVTSSEDVRLPIEPFIAALRVHAQAMERDAPVAEAMPAINALRQAAAAYVEAVMEASGWGNVFAGLFDDEEDDDSDVESDAPVTGITVLRRHDYAVVDERVVMEAGLRAYKVVWPDDSDEDAAADVNHLGRALYQIAHAQNWDALVDVEGLRPIGGSTLVHRQENLLSTDPDEWPEDVFETEGEDLFEQRDIFGPPPTR